MKIAHNSELRAAVERITLRLKRYEEGLRIKAFEVGDYPISDEHAADLRTLLVAVGQKLRNG
jgi:hypothetical protein